MGPMTACEAEAQKQPTRVTVNLRPQDMALAMPMKPGTTISLAIRGEVTSVSMGEYGSHFEIEVDSIAFKEPKPEKFIEELDAVRVSAED